LSATLNPQAPETHGLFRKTVHLDQVPDRAPARVTADSRYALFVNGQEVFRGPIRSQPRRLHYDLFDLAPYLQPGENVLAVYVTIEKTSLCTVHLSGDDTADSIIRRTKDLSAMGFTHAIFNMPDVYNITPLQTFAKEIIPAVAEL
jgi:hypothetical protein